VGGKKKSEDAKTRYGAGDLEGLEKLNGVPFIGAGQEEFRRLGLRAASKILARPPGSPRPPGLSLGAAPTH
jgi:hypothetical protein